MKLNFAVMASILALGGTAFASANEGAPVPAGSYQCFSYVRTARPGVNYTLPFGEAMVELESAKHDALRRCATDPQARNWAMLCQVGCRQN